MPPLVGVAVNVTLVPKHIYAEVVEIDTLGGVIIDTDSVMPVLVAVFAV